MEQVTPFGCLASGVEVQRVRLTTGELCLSVLTLGAILQDLRWAAGPGLTAGSAALADYEAGPLAYAGAVVGPVANRIGDARAELAGRSLRFEANAAGGHHLHGGADGCHAQVWDLKEVSQSHCVLTLDLDHGLGGYPGNRHLQATYLLSPQALTLTLEATTDAPTLLALANHSYWTLGTSVDGTRLQVLADRYLPTDASVLPTGEIATVDRAHDLRQGRDLGPADRFDTCFCLSDHDRPLRTVASVSAQGVHMDMATTAPGLQVFTADPFAAPGPNGHDGRRYGPRFGIALEAQGWPDAPNQPRFPTARLDPDQTFRQTTRWSFRRV